MVDVMQRYRAAIAVAVGSLTLTVATAWWSVANLPVSPGYQRALPDQLWFDGLVRWDSFWYMSIASDGYELATDVIAGVDVTGQSSVAFYPSFPLAVRLVSQFTNDVAIAGVLTSAVLAVVGFVLYESWLRQRFNGRDSAAALVALALSPGAFFLFGLMYTESLFLAASIGAFVLLERQRPVLAGVVGAVAVAARPVGIALALGLLVRSVEMMRRRENGWRDFRLADLGVFIAPLGFVAFATHLWVKFGSPFLSTQAASDGWGLGIGIDTILKRDEILALGSNLLVSMLVIIPQGLVVVAALAALPAIRRELGWAYVWYVGVAVVLPFVVRPTLIGNARYVAIAFPVFAVLGPRLLRWGFVGATLAGVSVAFMVFYLSLFSRWIFVG